MVYLEHCYSLLSLLPAKIIFNANNLQQRILQMQCKVLAG